MSRTAFCIKNLFLCIKSKQISGSLELNFISVFTKLFYGGILDLIIKFYILRLSLELIKYVEISDGELYL